MVLYQNDAVADTCLKKRFAFSWSQLLYETQAAQINRAIREYDQEAIIEVAPGPPHFTIEVRGVPKGVRIEGTKKWFPR